jgi:hypothetical protein
MKGKTMEPQFLLTQQIQANATAVEQNLSVLYDPNVPFEYKQVALRYVYAQSQQIEALVKGLYSQLKDIEVMMYGRR